jgi:branched-chain amino acid transport system ATP-binding protein
VPTDLHAGTGVTTTAAPTAPALELDDISVRFGGIAALDRVSLSVAPGELCGLIGPNGAGKTTLFDVVSGLRVPDGGTVRLDGHEATRWPAVRRARRGVRRTFQRVQTYGWLSVADNVLAALEWESGGGGLPADLVAFPSRRRREHERRARVATALGRCGLTAVADEPAGSLPIGLARMVELARAIVDRPRLLLLDEPTSGLEQGEVTRLGDLIREVCVDSGCAVLLVEHDVGFVMKHCRRIVVLDVGTVLAQGEPEAIQSNPAVRTAYLGEQ